MACRPTRRVGEVAQIPRRHCPEPGCWPLNLASHAGPMLSFAGLWGVAYLTRRSPRPAKRDCPDGLRDPPGRHRRRRGTGPSLGMDRLGRRHHPFPVRVRPARRPERHDRGPDARLDLRKRRHGHSAICRLRSISMPMPEYRFPSAFCSIAGDRGDLFLLAGAALISAVGSLLFSTSSLLTQAYAGRLLIGIGAGVCFVAALKIAMLWLPLTFIDTQRDRRAHHVPGYGRRHRRSGSARGHPRVRKLARGHDLGGRVRRRFAAARYGLPPDPGESATSRELPRKSRDGIAFSSTSRRSDGWCCPDLRPGCWPSISRATPGRCCRSPDCDSRWGVAYLMARFGLERTTAAIATSMMLVGWAWWAAQSRGLGLGSPATAQNPDDRVFSHCDRAGWPVIILAPALSPTAVVTLLSAIGFAGGAVIIGSPWPTRRRRPPRRCHGRRSGIPQT